MLGNLREQASQLEAVKVNLHKEDNRKAHNTDEYEIDQLILRRGQAFDVTVTFNRDYNPQSDVITLQFVTGKNPQQNKGGVVRVEIQDGELIHSKWGMRMSPKKPVEMGNANTSEEANGNTVHLSIMSSAQAAIGYYDVMVETKSKDSSGEESLHRHKHEEQICILFNAWCQDDVVYMENNEDLDLNVDEYVLKETGHIWRGSTRKMSKIPWNFGQFDEVALNSALWLLDKAELRPKAMSNVIHVVRTMTSMANSADRGGVLAGRWADDFPDGKVPWHWSGSVEILEQFWKTKEVVKYGQCWVFSGLLTSLLRALGIPTRSVTNFASAHDTEKSLTIDYHFDQDGKAMPHYNDDSVWNYHVWNECWFKRLDLPPGHDGWQAIDATPQEESGGLFQCGPASVNAIKNGEVYLNYDTDFIFAEVNADRVYWDVAFSGELKAFYVDKYSIGKNISTRKPGTLTERNDLTNYYKHPDGSDEERRVVEFVNKFSSKKDLEIYDPVVKDVTCKIDVVDEVKIGEAFQATATMKNESSKQRTVTGHFTAILVHYTGRAARTLKDEKNTVVLEPGEEKSATFKISPPELLGKSAVPDASIKIFFRGSVDETDQHFAIQDDVEFIKPELEVTAPDSTALKLNEKVRVTVSLTNPLPIDLTNGKFHFEFSRNMEPKTMDVDCKGPVRANGKTEITATFVPVNRPGFRSVSVNFNSSEVTGIAGDGYFYVSF
ncbi:protein-glutamine gamma-glutamyltransferase K-like isoform X2 [Oculina patagonica]